MLYMPSIFGENLMDDWMEDFDRDFDRFFYDRHNPLFGRHAKNLMKTDIRDQADHYEMDIELPGFHKEDIRLSLDHGYLTVQAAKGLSKDETDEKTGTVIRQERYAGALSRSFYVGEDVTEEDIQAKLEHGVLQLQIPKKDQKPALPEKRYIAIEG